MHYITNAAVCKLGFSYCIPGVLAYLISFIYPNDTMKPNRKPSGWTRFECKWS